MKKLLIMGLFSFLCCTHKSELKYEKGIVVEKQFSPEFDGSGMGVGMNSGGGTVITSNHVHKDEQFMIVFKCDHNEIFTIDDKEIYKKLEKGDTVSISFYEILTKKGKLKDFEFVDANKITQW